jgi:hypothetical protein
MTRRRGFLFLILLLAGGFLLGLGWIFAFQFQGGGAYPKGSSLRADLEGTMILYESLSRQTGLEVDRNFEPFDRLDVPPENTVLLMLRPFQWSLRDADLRDFVRSGGRVIVTPAWSRVRLEFDDETDSMEEAGGEEPEEDRQLLPLGESPVAESTAFTPGEDEWGTATWAAGEAGAPASIAWRSGAVFHEVEGEVLYRQNEQPVVVRLKEGKGEWIQLADASLLQNGAQYLHRESAWVVWLIGERTQVIFDEHHFGIERPQGVMTLIRDAGLDLYLWALILPLGLALWRASCPLLPAIPDDQEPDTDPLSRLEGYRDLLARHLPSPVILQHVFREWRQDQPPRSLESMQGALQEAESVVEMPLPRKHRLKELQKRFRHLTTLLNPHTRTRP